MREVDLGAGGIEATVWVISVAALTPALVIATCRSAISRGSFVTASVRWPRHLHTVSNGGLAHHVGPRRSNSLWPAAIGACMCEYTAVLLKVAAKRWVVTIQKRHLEVVVQVLVNSLKGRRGFDMML